MPGGSYLQRIAQRALGGQPALRPARAVRNANPITSEVPIAAAPSETRVAAAPAETPVAAQPRAETPPLERSGPPGGELRPETVRPAPAAPPEPAPVAQPLSSVSSSPTAGAASTPEAPRRMLSSPATISASTLPTEHPRALTQRGLEPRPPELAAPSESRSAEAPSPGALARESRRPIVQHNQPPGPDPLMRAMATAIRWSSLDDATPEPPQRAAAQSAPAAAPPAAPSHTSRAPAPAAAPAVAVPKPAPFAHTEAPANPPSHSAASSALRERAPARFPVAARADAHAPAAVPTRSVHIGSVSVEIAAPPERKPSPQPTRASVPAPGRPLARGLTSTIGLRQS